MQEGIVPTDIAKRYFALYQIKSVIEINGTKTTIKSIAPSLPGISQTIHFTTKGNSIKARNPLEFDFEEEGDRSGSLRVPSIIYKRENLIDFEMRINGVKVMGLDDMGHIELAPSILKEGTMDIVIPDINFIENVPYISFKSKDKLVLSFDTPLCCLDFIWDVENKSAKNCTVKTIYKDDYGKYEAAVSWAKFFIALFSGKELYLGQIVSGQLNYKLYGNLLAHFKKTIQYYENIHKIEVLRKASFSKHKKYEEDLEEASSIVYHLLAKDTVEEKINTSGRIECVLNPDAELPQIYSGDSIIKEYSAMRISTNTEQDILLNDENFGVITRWKDLVKCHTERIYERNGKKCISIAPDVDHWLVRYVKSE